MKITFAGLVPVLLCITSACGSDNARTPAAPGFENDAEVRDGAVTDAAADTALGDAAGDSGDSFAQDGAEASTDGDTAPTGDSAGDLSDASDGVADSGPPPWSAGVYANTSSALYRFDVDTSLVTEVGAFTTGPGTAVLDMIDIALDASGAMYGVSFGRLYRIVADSGKVRCNALATLGVDFAGLTFVPVGSIDAAAEVLVGVTADGVWYRIDVVSTDPAASLTKLGSHGGAWSSGGDAVAAGGVVLASAKTEGSLDHLVTVNAKTGAVVKDLGNTGYGGLRGLGYWGGSVYAFSLAGTVVKINPANAASSVVPTVLKPAGGWSGAAVATTVK